MQYAVDTEAYADKSVTRVDVDVGHSPRFGLPQERVNERDDRDARFATEFLVDRPHRAFLYCKKFYCLLTSDYKYFIVVLV